VLSSSLLSFHFSSDRSSPLFEGIPHKEDNDNDDEIKEKEKRKLSSLGISHMRLI